MGSTLEFVRAFLLNLLLLRKITQTGVAQNNKTKTVGEPGLLTIFQYIKTSNKEEVNNLFSMCMVERGNRFEYGNDSV